MQNREELRQKDHDRSQKTTYHKMGKNIIFFFFLGGGISFLDRNIDPVQMPTYRT
jgi:hypothetical protein